MAQNTRFATGLLTVHGLSDCFYRCRIQAWGEMAVPGKGESWRGVSHPALNGLHMGAGLDKDCDVEMSQIV